MENGGFVVLNCTNVVRVLNLVNLFEAVEINACFACSLSFFERTQMFKL